jgi:hypothetical protein
VVGRLGAVDAEVAGGGGEGDGRVVELLGHLALASQARAGTRGERGLAGFEADGLRPAGERHRAGR